MAKTFSPLLQLKWFFRLATERKLTGSDQLMYLHIFNKFNEAHWTESLRIKDAELKESMRLFDMEGRPASSEILRRGRQRLKGRGFINFESGGGREPEYSLIRLYPDGTPDDTPAGSGLVSYTVRAEDVKTEEEADAGASGRDLTKNGENAPTDSPLAATSANAHERVSVKFAKNDFEDLDEVLECWERNCGAGLSFEEQSQFKAWIDRFGKEWLQKVIQEAKEKSYAKGMSMRYIKKYIAQELSNSSPSQKKSTKGGGYGERVKEQLAKLEALGY